MKLWLDDQRRAPKGWVLAQTPWDFKECVRRFGPTITHMSFDHDLGSGYENGHEVATWLEELIHDNPLSVHKDVLFYVHSANPHGARQIAAALNSSLIFMGRRASTMRVDAEEMYE